MFPVAKGKTNKQQKRPQNKTQPQKNPQKTQNSPVKNHNPKWTYNAGDLAKTKTEGMIRNACCLGWTH